MKLTRKLFIIVIFLLPFSASGYEYSMFGSGQQMCFSSAMVGMDSVINARLNLPPEHALDVTLISKTSKSGEAIYDYYFLNIMLNAYLWRESPHNYAVKVFYDCAVNSAYAKQASIH